MSAGFSDPLVECVKCKHVFAPIISKIKKNVLIVEANWVKLDNSI